VDCSLRFAAWSPSLRARRKQLDERRRVVRLRLKGTYLP
jgi:hypothetical protein